MTEPIAHAEPPDETQLLDRLLGGDEAAFLALVRQYHGALVRMAILYCGNRATAEEVAQETWLAVLRGLPTFRRQSRFKTWLFRILANRARTRAVREKRYVPFATQANDDVAEPAVPDSSFDARGHWIEPPVAWRDAEVQLGERELVALLEPALAALSPVQRAVVTLRDIEGLDAEEVCNVLDLTETNQRVLLHRARARLRRALAAHLGHGAR